MLMVRKNYMSCKSAGDMRIPLEIERQAENEKIAACVVDHLPIVKAYATKIGLVQMINQLIPSEMDVDPTTIFFRNDF